MFLVLRKPNYNSFISIFHNQLLMRKKQILMIIQHLYIDNLCRKITEVIKNNIYSEKLEISSDVKIKVSEVLKS